MNRSLSAHRKVWLFFVLFLLACSSFAQSQRAYVDSILNHLENDPEIRTDDFEIIEAICNDAEEVSKSINYSEGLFRANLTRLELFRDFSDEKVAPFVSTLDSILQVNHTEVSDEYILGYYLARGYICGKQGHFLEELSFYLQADSLCKSSSIDPSLHLYVEQHLAVYYFTQEDYENAKIIFENIIEDQEEQGIPNPSGYALYKFNLGVIIKHLGDIPTARSLMLEGIKLGSSEYKDALYQYTMLAESYIHSDLLDSAQFYIEEAEELITDENKSTIDLVNFHLLRSYLNFELKNYAEASKFADLAVSLSDTLNFMHGSMEGKKWAIKCILAENEPEEGLGVFKSYLDLRDTLEHRASLKLEKEYLIEYQTLEKEAEAQRKEAENKELQIENSFFRKSMVLYTLLTLTLIATFLLAVKRNKTKKLLLQKELELNQKEKERIQLELEHNIDSLQQSKKRLMELEALTLKEESIQRIQEVFDSNYVEENHWDTIMIQFESIHPGYIEGFKKSEVGFTRNDIKIAILDKLGYSTTSMQEILNISYEGVRKAKQRFNKKRHQS